MPRTPPKPVPYRTRFGSNVAKLRVAKNLTQELVAEKIGVSGRYYQSIEGGQYYPSLGKLLLLQKVLDCPWAAFFEGCVPDDI